MEIALTLFILKVEEKVKQNQNLRSLGRANQFCVYDFENERKVAKYYLKYKPRFKVTLSLIMAWFQCKICQKPDVIRLLSPMFEVNFKWIISAGIIYFFSYIIKDIVDSLQLLKLSFLPCMHLLFNHCLSCEPINTENLILEMLQILVHGWEFQKIFSKNVISPPKD